MKIKLCPLFVVSCLFLSANVWSIQKHIYLNENLGFNIPGYKYKQTELPCEVDKYIVEQLIKDAPEKGFHIEGVTTRDKILNGEIPVLAIDIDGIYYGREGTGYGTVKRSDALPSINITTAIFYGESGKQYKTEKHACGFASLAEISPSASSVMDLGTSKTICGVMKVCIKELNRDIFNWLNKAPIQ